MMALILSFVLLQFMGLIESRLSKITIDFIELEIKLNITIQLKLDWVWYPVQFKWNVIFM
jgi:hypothetical protein